MSNKLKTKIKTPISYYGGKGRMASHIIALMPVHTVYCEPFFGGGAVFFAKPVPQVTNDDHYRKAINDLNGDVANFWRQLRDNGDELARLCDLTPYSQEEYRIAKDLAGSDGASDLERARRLFVNANQSFANKLDGGWGTGTYSGNSAATFESKKSCLQPAIERLRGVHIGNEDALKFIERWDSPQTLFYCDPPYPEANQGHYKGYTIADFNELIALLETCKGAAMVSCYAKDGMVIPEGWERRDFASVMSASNGKTGDKSRVESVFIRPRSEQPRPELLRVMQGHEFDCFLGGGQHNQEDMFSIASDASDCESDSLDDDFNVDDIMPF